MHSEFSVEKSTEVKHKVGCVIEVAKRLNKTSVKDVIEVANLYGITYNDIQEWESYWKEKGLFL